MGADDYVGKPFDERELIERVSALLRIKRLHDELHQARIELEKLATHDDLTGLYNYRYLRTRLDDEFKRSKRYRTPLSCLMVDVDRFKSINDEHGHEIGNAVLQELATRMTDTMREVDVVARYGGEEFVLLLPETGGPQGVMAAERLRLAVGGRMFQVEGRTIAATISAGVSYYPAPNLETRDDLLRAADRALYRAKRAGRDRVCFVGDEAD
jgi:diguanylate cyclase (GGDEF)-like protein